MNEEKIIVVHQPCLLSSLISLAISLGILYVGGMVILYTIAIVVELIK